MSIACHIHDYFEAACVLHYRLRVADQQGNAFEGIALDIRSTNRQECLVLKLSDADENSETLAILLSQIRQAKVLTSSAQFSEIPLQNHPILDKSSDE